MKVSIICTNFNKGDWVREAIDSFLNQETNFDFEIIIIDDASTDHSYEIIQEKLKVNISQDVIVMIFGLTH